MQHTSGISPSRLLSAAEVETIYGPRLNEMALQALRSTKKGPRYRKIGRAVVYRAADIEVWLDSGIVDPTGGAPKASANRTIAAQPLRILAREVSDAINNPPSEWANWTAGDRLVYLLDTACEALLVATDSDR